MSTDDNVKRMPRRRPPAAEAEAESPEPLAVSASKNYEKYLRCTLTDAEKLTVASRLADRMTDLQRKEDEFDDVKNQFKGELSRLSAEITAARNLVRDGYEFRNVQVEEERNYETKIFRVTRLDTGEIIEERPLRDEELQRFLPGMENEPC